MRRERERERETEGEGGSPLVVMQDARRGMKAAVRSSPPSRRSHPARHPPPPSLPLPLPPLVPATQMASRRAHFISASYSRPARRRKWKQWDTAVIRYRMLVASLNSHLYYLSASKSARARRRIPPPLPPPSPELPTRASSSSPLSRRRDALCLPPTLSRHRITGCI